MIDILESFGFVASLVASEEEALLAANKAIAKGTPFQLVIMDKPFPKNSFIKTVKMIVESSQRLNGETPKVILLTSAGQENAENVQKEIKEKVDACFLPKPVVRDSLFNVIMGQFGLDISCYFKSRGKAVDLESLKQKIEGARVLLVEDNVINQNVAREMLIYVGLWVDVAENGHDAIRMVGESEYDMVLMDIQMPEMDGYEASRRLRNDFYTWVGYHVPPGKASMAQVRQLDPTVSPADILSRLNRYD